MANDVVQYPSYSQKAAYPVSHKSAAAVVEVEAEAVAPEEQTPKFFPLVPVESASVADTDAPTEDQTQAEPEQLAEELPEASVELEVEVGQDSEVEPEPVVEPELVVEPEPVAELSPFQISGSLVLEPQTNSIVITQVPDALLAGSIVTETGEILTTGAIDIITPPATGEIEIIPDSPDADSADAIDSATEYVSSVAPIRSSGVMNSKAKIGVLPGKLRKSMEHVVLATTLAVAIITISSLLALAYMFGILR